MRHVSPQADSRPAREPPGVVKHPDDPRWSFVARHLESELLKTGKSRIARREAGESRGDGVGHVGEEAAKGHQARCLRAICDGEDQIGERPPAELRLIPDQEDDVVFGLRELMGKKQIVGPIQVSLTVGAQTDGGARRGALMGSL